MVDKVREIHTENMRHIDCINQPCPLPLMETRKAVMKGKSGDIVKITGTHGNSKFEIPMALDSMKCEIREVTEENGVWSITFRIP